LARLLRIDPDSASFGERLRLGHASRLQAEIERMEADQNEGKPVNVQQLTLAYEELGRLIEGTDADRPTQDIDMSRLSDDEVRTMERILAKAHGEDIARDVKAWLAEQAKRNVSSQTSEIVRAVRRSMEAEQEKAARG
jgi:hypothetical protein